MRIPAVIVAIALGAGHAGATCNVIPSTDRLFPSTLGAVSRPFARPGDEVVVRRTEPVFAVDPGANAVALTFLPPGVDDVIEVTPVEVLPRDAGGGCGPDACTAAGCTCLRFRFPDTDGRVGGPTDRRTLTGPVEIRVRTFGQETSAIGRLFIGNTKFGDDLFPHFLGLPPANRFADFVAGAFDAQAAEDTAGNLFVPLDFTGIVPEDERRTRFLEASVPNLGMGGSLHIDVFTVAGQRLPPLVRQVQERGDDLLGTADTRESVFRIEKGALRPRLVPLDGGGPTLVPDVSASVDAAKQADPGNMVVGKRFAVYEARECDPRDVRGCGHDESTGGSCVRLNDDDDGTDWFLYAIDLSAPRQQPIKIAEVDACLDEKLKQGYPRDFPGFGLFSFSASDSLVAFRIVEAGIDIDRNGRDDDLLQSGAYDLVQRRPIFLGGDSARQEVDGAILAFSRPAAGSADDVLYWYMAGPPDATPRFVADAVQPRYPVTRHPVGGVDRGRRVHPHDFAVGGGRIAFVGPDRVVRVFDTATGLVTPLAQPITSDAGEARLAMTARRLAYQTEKGDGTLGVTVRDLETLATSFACAEPGSHGVLAPSVSDAMVPCLQGGSGGELHVLPPDGVERSLGLRIADPSDVQVSGDVLAVGVEETLQGADLDGDGATSGLVLHAFNVMRGGVPTNFRRRLIRSTPPFLQFIERGLVVLTGTEAAPVRTIFRDVDGDGIFEEPIPEGPGRDGPIVDNCPTVPNPSQRDDGDGVGEACECPLLRVDTVRAFAGSRVRVPVDFDPGQNTVAATNFPLDARAAAGTAAWATCEAGPVVRTARAHLACSETSPGLVTSFVADAGTQPVRTLEAGEIAAYEFAVSLGTRARTFDVCIEDRGDDVAFGNPEGFDIVCAMPPHCGEVRVDPFCDLQGDCNCDGAVNGGDRVCLITKFFDPDQRGTCDCEDCNLSGRLNAADGPCITRCSFGDCVTGRAGG